jgi:hypothetical protein
MTASCWCVTVPAPTSSTIGRACHPGFGTHLLGAVACCPAMSAAAGRSTLDTFETSMDNPQHLFDVLNGCLQEGCVRAAEARSYQEGRCVKTFCCICAHCAALVKCVKHKAPGVHGEHYPGNALIASHTLRKACTSAGESMSLAALHTRGQCAALRTMQAPAPAACLARPTASFWATPTTSRTSCTSGICTAVR